jgi:hypothetical protein
MSRENLMTCLSLTGGVALGALTMYFFDPARGHHRRALCMDQLNSAANTVKDAVDSAARDLTNRARGVLAEAKSAVTRGPAHEAETTGGERAAV